MSPFFRRSRCDSPILYGVGVFQLGVSKRVAVAWICGRDVRVPPFYLCCRRNVCSLRKPWTRYDTQGSWQSFSSKSSFWPHYRSVACRVLCSVGTGGLSGSRSPTPTSFGGIEMMSLPDDWTMTQHHYVTMGYIIFLFLADQKTDHSRKLTIFAFL